MIQLVCVRQKTQQTNKASQLPDVTSASRFRLIMSFGDAEQKRLRKGFKLVLLGDASVGKSSILVRPLDPKATADGA